MLRDRLPLYFIWVGEIAPGRWNPHDIQEEKLEVDLWLKMVCKCESTNDVQSES